MPVEIVPLGAKSDITYSPRFEQYLVARWAGYTDEAFERMSSERRAKHVAAYRQFHAMNAAEAYTQERKARSKRHGG